MADIPMDSGNGRLKLAPGEPADGHLGGLLAENTADILATAGSGFPRHAALH